MSIASRYGELFQMSYITRDLDAAMEHAKRELGVTEFHTTDAELDVLSYGEIKPLKLRAAIANIGRHQFEIIQPVSGAATSVYTDHVDLDSHILNFHHVAIAVRGGIEDWLTLIEEVKASGDEFAFLAPPEPTGSDKVCFAYVDTRKRLGHFTEYLWVDESIKPIPAMPDLDA
jgi:hypothetical protein